MELREPIESINGSLIDHYGRSIDDGRPNYRVVWSDDQVEKRRMTHNDRGEELIMPEVRLVPKYKQWIRHRYVLERLIPVTGETDLLEKIVYEPVWTFQDKHQKYLPPFFEGCKHIIENILMNMGAKNVFAKYKETGLSQEEQLAHLQKVEDELFGNETDVTDALTYGYGVVVPSNFIKDNGNS
jgi:hypothetical protein